MTNTLMREKFYKDIQYYFYEKLELFHHGVDHVFRRYVLEEEYWNILDLCHSSFYIEHYAPRIIALKSNILIFLVLNYLKLLMSIVLVF